MQGVNANNNNNKLIFRQSERLRKTKNKDRNKSLGVYAPFNFAEKEEEKEIEGINWETRISKNINNDSFNISELRK